MGLFDNKKKKSNEMTLPLLSSIADVVTSVGSGFAQGFEKAIDSGASLASWYARLAGMDNAERKLNEFIAKDLIGDGSRMAETDAKVLEGKKPLNYNGEMYYITGDSIGYDITKRYTFINDIRALGFSTPYDASIKDGTTVKSRLKYYTYYNGEWYPSKKSN